MEGVRGCWDFLWIGLKPSTWSEREYKSAGAVTLDIPLGFLSPNSIFAFDTSDHVRCLIWLAFLALLSGPLTGFGVSLSCSLGPIFEDLLPVLDAAFFWHLLFSPGLGNVLGMSGGCSRGRHGSGGGRLGLYLWALTYHSFTP